MATSNKGLNQPVIGSTGWGAPLNDNATILDKALGSFTTISDVTGVVNLTLAQTQNMCVKSTTSAFLSDVTFTIPSGVAGQWVFVNQSATNAYNLIIKNVANAASVMIQNGQTRTVYSDGNIVFFVDTQSASVLQSFSIGNGFATASATCVGTNATVTFSGGYLIAVGQTISIKGITPAGYNGVWTVTASSAGSVTFVVPSTLGSQTIAGTLYYGAITGSTLNLSGKGAVSGVATQAEAVAGTDNTTLMTPLRTAQAITALDLGIGVGQTWQNVLGSRTFSTSYQNLTAKPIMVAITTNGSTTARPIQVSVDNVTFIQVGTDSGGASDTSFIVPVNYYYRINGSTTIVAWAELR